MILTSAFSPLSGERNNIVRLFRPAEWGQQSKDLQRRLRSDSWNLGTWTLRGKRDFADGVKVTEVELGGRPGLSGWA